MYQITKEFKFCAAHKLKSSYTKACQVVHGHNYRILVCIESTTLNADGMVIDFGKVKDNILNLIDAMDHKMLIWGKETDIVDVKAEFFVPFNPTAENIARAFYDDIARSLANLILDTGKEGVRERSPSGFKRDVKVRYVQVYETDSSSATYFG